MTDSFDDLCLRVDVLVDDMRHQVALVFRRPGRQAECSDRELQTLALVGECRDRANEPT